MTVMPQQAGMPRREGGLGRRALIRNGLVVSAGVAMLGAGSAIRPGAARASTTQNNWRRCIHCGGLCWAGDGDAGQLPAHLGVCPYQGTGQPHSPGSLNMTLDSGDAAAAGSVQVGWRWCENCYGLFWAAGKTQNGVCPDGGHHVASGSIYDMYINALPYYNGENSFTGWDWCGKCQGLYWGNGNNAAGLCPDGGTHIPGSGTNYVMAYE
jgi:hypothetical protein